MPLGFGPGLEVHNVEALGCERWPAWWPNSWLGRLMLSVIEPAATRSFWVWVFGSGSSEADLSVPSLALAGLGLIFCSFTIGKVRQVNLIGSSQEPTQPVGSSLRVQHLGIYAPADEEGRPDHQRCPRRRD